MRITLDSTNKYIRITDIDDNTHIYTGLDLVSPNADLELKYRVQENDILFARTGATVGKTYLYNKNDGILFFAGFLIRVNIPIDNSYYVYEQTLTGRYLNWIRIMSQRSGQPGINAQEYGTYSFPYCCVKEQQKIAAILTTQDKAIELKEKRLAEKQRQKKYLMQQLLTVRKRLPGYIGEWTTLPLKYLSEKQKKKNSGFQYSLVLSNSAQHGIVLQDQEFTKEIANAERIDGYYIVVPGAFVYNPRISISAPCGPINVNETGKTGIVSPLYIVFSISAPEIDQIFLKYYFQSSCWYKYVKGVANYGARHDRISISDEDFFEMPIPLPIKDEQSAIAQVLSAADREISLLRQDIEQEKQKKKALMQLLLTGIVRVKI